MCRYKYNGTLSHPGEAHGILLDIAHDLSAVTDPSGIYFALQNVEPEHDDADKQRICTDVCGKMRMTLVPYIINEAVKRIQNPDAAKTTAKAALPVQTTLTSEDAGVSSVLTAQAFQFPVLMPPFIKKIICQVFPPSLWHQATNMMLGMLQARVGDVPLLSSINQLDVIVMNTCVIAGFGGYKTTTMDILSGYLLSDILENDRNERKKLQKYLLNKAANNNTSALSAPPAPKV